MGSAVQEFAASPWRLRLPESANVEAVEGLVIGDEGDILHLALCDEHAVEGVSVFTKQAPDSLCMQQGDIQ